MEVWINEQTWMACTIQIKKPVFMHKWHNSKYLRVMPMPRQKALMASGVNPLRRSPASVGKRQSSHPSTWWSVTSLLSWNFSVPQIDQSYPPLFLHSRKYNFRHLQCKIWMLSRNPKVPKILTFRFDITVFAILSLEYSHTYGRYKSRESRSQ